MWRGDGVRFCWGVGIVGCGSRSEVSCPSRALWGWMAIGDGEDSGQIHTPDGELEIVRVRAFVGVVAARVDLCAAGF